MKKTLKELLYVFGLMFCLILSCGLVGLVILDFEYVAPWIFLTPFIWFFSTKKAIDIMVKLSKDRRKELDFEIYNTENVLLELHYTKREWLPFKKAQKKNINKLMLKSSIWILVTLLLVGIIAFEELSVALVLLNFAIIMIISVFKIAYKPIFDDYRSFSNNYVVKFYLQGLTVNNKNYIYNKYVGLDNSFKIKDLKTQVEEGQLFLNISYLAEAYFQGSLDMHSGDLRATLNLKIPLAEHHKVDIEKLKVAYNIV